MSKNLVEVVFVLDRSGSMAGLESDTIGGFNSMLKKQKNEDAKVYVSTVLFDNRIDVLHNRVEIKDVEPITEKEYYVGGCTALLDAVGRSIRHISRIHKYAREEDRPFKTLFVIITDGYENSSTKYTYRDVKKMISKEQEKYGWEFIFLGADIDVAREADNLGIRREHAVSYKKSKRGVARNFEAVSCCMDYVLSRPCESRYGLDKVLKDNLSEEED